MCHYYHVCLVYSRCLCSLKPQLSLLVFTPKTCEQCSEMLHFFGRKIQERIPFPALLWTDISKDKSSKEVIGH